MYHAGWLRQLRILIGRCSFSSKRLPPGSRFFLCRAFLFGHKFYALICTTRMMLPWTSILPHQFLPAYS